MILSLWFTRQTAWGQVSAGAGFFERGRTRLSVTAGYGSFNDKDYAVLGLGAGYYLWDGLEAGLEGESWVGNAPRIYKVSPQITYVFYELEAFKPYIGGVYRHTFFDQSLSDADSGGGRAGIIVPLSPHTYLGAGVVYERFFHCDRNVSGTCSQTYPEVSFAISY